MSLDNNLVNLIKETIKNQPELNIEETKSLAKKISLFATLTGEPPSHYFNFEKIQEVSQATKLSKQSIYRLASAKEFPSPIKLSSGPNGRSSAWIYGERLLWAHDRILASRNSG